MQMAGVQNTHCRCPACPDADAAVSQRFVPPCDPISVGNCYCCCCCLTPLQVLEEVRVLLQPNAGGVVAELDKLNVYGPGGFFKPHFDTPRSEGKPLRAHAYAHAHATVC
jgi:hypothetical protein